MIDGLINQVIAATNHPKTTIAKTLGYTYLIVAVNLLFSKKMDTICDPFEKNILTTGFTAICFSIQYFCAHFSPNSYASSPAQLKYWKNFTLASACGLIATTVFLFNEQPQECF